MKRIGQFAVGVGISGLFLWLAFRDVSLAAVRSSLEAADPRWMAAVAFASLLALWARGQRWRYLFVHLKPIPVRTLASSQAIGFAANTALPFRAGEAVKAYSLTRKTGLPFSTTLASVVLERVFDMMAVGVFLTAALWMVPIPDAASAQVSAAIRLLGIVAGAATGTIAALVVWRERMLRWIDRLLDLLPQRVASPARRVVHALVDGLDALTDARQLAMLSLSSIWVWIVLAMPYGFTALALGLHESSGASIVSLSVVSVALVAVFVMIPAAPGFVGTFQAGCVLALGLFGVDRADALGYSLLLHAVTFIPAALVGGVLMVREGLGGVAGRVASDSSDAVGPGRRDVV